uniref:Large ribosomal subunit protein uL16m n=1 Tax=Hirondellea gigas TaxID=1518452 RepID=A0A2P2HYS6_9CRUS
MPEKEDRKLKFLTKTPIFIGVKAPKYTRRIDLVRGFEDLQTNFLHGQYGIISLGGGFLEWGHIEMIRNTVGKKIDTRKMVAHWRIEPPWLPRTKKGIGKRMGGGRPGINRYVYPIKADRVIIEMGGKCSFEEVLPILRVIAANLPFPAEAISAEKLAEKRRIRVEIEAANINPISFKYLAQNNLLGCDVWLNTSDRVYYGKCI